MSASCFLRLTARHRTIGVQSHKYRAGPISEAYICEKSTLKYGGMVWHTISALDEESSLWAASVCHTSARGSRSSFILISGLADGPFSYFTLMGCSLRPRQSNQRTKLEIMREYCSQENVCLFLGVERGRELSQFYHVTPNFRRVMYHPRFIP